MSVAAPAVDLDDSHTRSIRSSARSTDPSSFKGGSSIFQELRDCITADKLDEHSLLDLIARLSEIHAEQHDAWCARIGLPEKYRAEVEARLSRQAAAWVKFTEIVAAPIIARGSIFQKVLGAAKRLKRNSASV